MLKVFQKSITLTDDQGGITVIVISLCLALLSCISLLGFGINGLITANRLNHSADRVALAAATLLVSNPEEACSVAEQLAADNQVKLMQCSIQDDIVSIQVGTDWPAQHFLAKWWQIGMSRAGVDYIYD